jgi:hypothetical protein
MNRSITGVILVGVMGLAGCATTAETETYQKYRAARDADQEPLVGSRLVKPTTERIVNVIGNQEYKDSNPYALTPPLPTPGK